ncbi:fasciclin domain-containing protein [Chitinophaga tropicalis]|uniref:FAS1 domain-containing protein n=1 Tax=Chitinophaga tropicalis TaxID=2683588 RepID=A0A7K1UDP7_9BACT|nr:fasciclin domain-containing protein [Chitinophaga tropicalis]MVT12388.1 hypothetical protein [Chitinophaga tropicalis]
MKKTILYILLVLMAVACRKDKWNERTGIDDPALRSNLFQAIQQRPELSKFAEYLVKTGYDKVLASSKTFTVFAPDNGAWQQVDPAILADTARLKSLIGNHITGQSYPTVLTEATLRIRALNGKNVLFSRTQVDDINITTANQYSANGMLHIIGSTIMPKQNAWEFLNSYAAGTMQQTFLQSLTYTGIDTSQAEQIGVDPLTGLPIYKPGTGLVERNHFLQRININSEDSALTYIILTDRAFMAEKNRLIKYFQDSTAALTDTITRWNVVKDLALGGVYAASGLPGTAYGLRDSVVYHPNMFTVISSHKVSNGMVYIVDDIAYETASKIKPVIIQGENVNDVRDRTKAWAVRTRINPLTGLLFRDFYMENHGISSYWINYMPLVYSAKYKVYWVAVNDFQTATFPMKIAFKDPAATEFAYKTVALRDFSEVYLGEYTADRYGRLPLYLVGNNVTTNGANTLVLDYIKLVPILD